MTEQERKENIEKLISERVELSNADVALLYEMMQQYNNPSGDDDLQRWQELEQAFLLQDMFEEAVVRAFADLEGARKRLRYFKETGKAL